MSEYISSDVLAEEAKKLGMQAWAYDENGWPSGFVGGKLLETILKLGNIFLTCSICSGFGSSTNQSLGRFPTSLFVDG